MVATADLLLAYSHEKQKFCVQTDKQASYQPLCVSKLFSGERTAMEAS